MFWFRAVSAQADTARKLWGAEGPAKDCIHRTAEKKAPATVAGTPQFPPRALRARICARIFRTDSLSPPPSLMAAGLSLLPGKRFGHNHDDILGYCDILRQTPSHLVLISFALFIR